jgi:hypothetical protein
MIHEAFTKAYIAFRYYSIKHPERNYTSEQARKQFMQDNNVDKSLLRKVIDEIYSEQKGMLKKS